VKKKDADVDTPCIKISVLRCVMTQWSIQFNYSSGQDAKGVQIYREGSTGRIPVKSAAFARYLRKIICALRRVPVVPFPRSNVGSDPFRLTGPDVAFFSARKIVSKAGYVIVRKGPENQRCDYEMALLHGSSGEWGAQDGILKRRYPRALLCDKIGLSR